MKKLSLSKYFHAKGSKEALRTQRFDLRISINDLRFGKLSTCFVNLCASFEHLCGKEKIPLRALRLSADGCGLFARNNFKQRTATKR
jgi:hypothetical protein